VLDWLGAHGHGDYLGKAVPAALLAGARRSYAAAYGLPVQVLPSAALRQGWGSEDLFHLDMLLLSQGLSLADAARVLQRRHADRT